MNLLKCHWKQLWFSRWREIIGTANQMQVIVAIVKLKLWDYVPKKGFYSLEPHHLLQRQGTANRNINLLKSIDRGIRTGLLGRQSYSSGSPRVLNLNAIYGWMCRGYTVIEPFIMMSSMGRTSIVHVVKSITDDLPDDSWRQRSGSLWRLW